MSVQRKLTLEVLSGPLDGAMIMLEGKADWGQTGTGPLAFPWDDELGEPQARFTVHGQGWHMQGLKAPHGTYQVNKGGRISETVVLDQGDLLKASQTWLRVQDIV
jgi:hypothetical protein